MELIMKEYRVEREIAGRKLSISTGLLAKQAAGAALVQYGDTVVLSAVASEPGDADSTDDFFPLLVDYREKSYAAGKFPGGFFKREKAPTTKETLTMRLTDRPIRPLFPKGFRDDVVIQSMVLSSDMENEGDILSIIGASAALSLSKLPFNGPIGAVRMGMIGGNFIINPIHSEIRKTELNLVVAGTSSSIAMVEAGANELTEDKMLEALNAGHAVIKTVCEMINELVAKAGRTEKMTVTPPKAPSCYDTVRAASYDKLKVAVCTEGKFGRKDAAKAVYKEIVAQLAKSEAEGGPVKAEVVECLDKVRTEVIRALIKNNTRLDGRDLYTVRPIDCRVGVLPRTHGSSLFTRGETQALVAVTLGSSADSQKVDGLHEAYDENWYLHYQAPGFSVGESRPPRGPGRRDIGHGMLAQRALEAVIPNGEKGNFPYTVRAVSEVLEMNGSSSMATVCGATLALMDAGVPITKPVAGIAMGLIQDAGQEPVVITDILGDEDHYGDMDFKVCGTKDGITALQMDIKVEGISTDTMRKALYQARDGRLHILGKITGCIETPRAELNPRAPRLHSIMVPIDMIGKVIGPGGKTIRALQEDCGVKIDIADDGEVTICAPENESLMAAVRQIEAITATVEPGATYEGTVTGIREFGAFVEILPGTEGMCHISEFSDEYVKSLDGLVQVGDPVRVRVIEVDAGTGKIRLSRKAVLCEEKGIPYEASSGGGGGGGDRRGGGSRRPRRD